MKRKERKREREREKEDRYVNRGKQQKFASQSRSEIITRAKARRE